jgi:hypothetical protein
MWPRWLTAVGCGLALAPVGCFLIPNPPTPVGRKGVFRDEIPGDPQVVFDTRVLEQPLGDPYLTRGLWAATTDPLPHHLSALLAANGLRAGVLSGPRPAEFDALAGGDGTALSPTLRRGLVGQPKTVPVNGPLDRCTASVTDELTADPRPLTATAAECAVTATATPQPSGTVAVRFEWVLQHGEKKARWTPTADGGFDRTDERAKEAFPALAFEVTLDPADTLILGPTAKPAGTLGAAFFHTADDAKTRVLVLRAGMDR